MAENNEIDFGPLTYLIGTWEGDKGLDIAPTPDGSEENPYYETITFEAVGDVTNAESQTLAVIRYHQVVSRKSNNEVFHDEIGYWMWDAKEKVVMHSLVIPRSVGLLAGGNYTDSGSQGDTVNLAVSAKLGDPDWGIVQSPFMRDNARTTEFRHTITIKGNTLSYSETTVLEIYGKTFDHTDENELTLKE
ncbi:MAG: heme-binding beta-barrel domain-containing protein [Thermodesulfobacteriota bacterium]